MKKAASILFALAMISTTVFTCMGSSHISMAAGDPSQTAVVTTGITEWQYRDDNTVPADGWMTSEKVTDQAWKTGKGSFGAKNGVIGDLGGGCTPEVLLNQYISDKVDIPIYYFRATFDVEDSASVQKITGEVLYDDAATVYVNGVRIAGFDDDSFDENGYGGSNASAPKTGEITYTQISKLNLKSKGNVIAVELHNGRSSSSDIYLDIKDITLHSGDPEQVPQDVKSLSLEIGADESQRNVAWLGTSGKETYLQVAEKPEGYSKGDAFPEKGANTYTASQSDSQVSGFKSNKATMKDLKENTFYLYRVGNEEKWSDVYEFDTKDFGDGHTFSFLFAGDPQIGASGNAGNDTENWQNTMRRALNAFPETRFLLSAGDQVNSNSSDSQYTGFLSPEAIRKIPLAVNVGNHDNGNSRYTDYYNMPNVSGKGVSGSTGSGCGDYWFMYNGTLFMSINSNNTSTAEHKAFLEEALAKNPEAVWTVVTFHHSTYSVANHYTDTDIIQRRKDLSPVFSDLGIDVVLMGHDHYYTRTYMMDGSNPVIPEGNNVSKGEEAPSVTANPEEGQVFYLTANSASGSKYYGKNGSLGTGWPEYVAVQDQSNRTSITNVTVSENEFTVETYYTDSDELSLMDSFTIRRTEKPKITLKEENTELKVGDAFDPMAGVTAADCDGVDLTDLVYVTVYQITGKGETQVQYVDSSAEGTYHIVYDVTDSYGKTATAERTVTVTKDNTGTSNPGTDTPGGGSPGTDTPGTGNPGVDIPGTGNPGVDIPGTDNPGTGADRSQGSDQNSNINQTNNGNRNGSLVKTGDTTLPVSMFIIIMGAAGAGIVYGIRKKCV